MTATALVALQRRAAAAVEVQAPRIAELSDDVLRRPETGYREVATSGRVADELVALGLEVEEGLAVTGVKARLRGGGPGPTVAILGELDSLAVPGHPFADPVTGHAHACGHNAQVAAMVGAAVGLQAVAGELDGDVVLLATPAEECIEVGWRLARRAAGDLEFVVGKPELLRLGAFDDVDLALTSHTGGAGPGLAVVAGTGTSANGSLVKHATFRGRAAHSGHAPWDGIDAQKALTLAVAAVDAQRETFRDDDHVRVHHLITGAGAGGGAGGGGAVSSVPAEAGLELVVRAATVEGMRDASQKVDRALRAGALALGAGVSIDTVAGYFPYVGHGRGDALLVDSARSVLGADRVSLRAAAGHSGSGSDLGDLARIMPVLAVLTGGAAPGTWPHDSGFYTADQRAAAVDPAKALASATVALLAGGAGAVRALVADHEGMAIDDYVALRRSLESSETYPP